MHGDGRCTQEDQSPSKSPDNKGWEDSHEIVGCRRQGADAPGEPNAIDEQPSSDHSPGGKLVEQLGADAAYRDAEADDEGQIGKPGAYRRVTPHDLHLERE